MYLQTRDSGDSDSAHRILCDHVTIKKKSKKNKKKEEEKAHVSSRSPLPLILGLASNPLGFVSTAVSALGEYL